MLLYIFTTVTNNNSSLERKEIKREKEELGVETEKNQVSLKFFDNRIQEHCAASWLFYFAFIIGN